MTAPRANAEFRIGGHVIGRGPCFIIAEAGVNHDGDLGRARELIAAAAAAGVNAVKFQTWITEKICRPGARKAEYQNRAAGVPADQFAILKALELPYAWHEELKALAEQHGIVFLSTPDEIDSARFLARLGVEALKIGSGEIGNLPYLEQLGALGLPVILSTGMADLPEVEQAFQALVRGGCRSVALLHCVSAYPAPEEDVNLRCIATLRDAFRVPVGFSDHTAGTSAAVLATALGCAVLEKHLTLDRRLPGPDHAASIEPGEFKRLVSEVRRVETMLGNGVKRMAASETDTRRAVERSLVFTRAVAAGATLAAEDVVALRTGEAGLPPAALPRLLGRTLRIGAAAGESLREDHLR